MVLLWDQIDMFGDRFVMVRLVGHVTPDLFNRRVNQELKAIFQCLRLLAPGGFPAKPGTISSPFQLFKRLTPSRSCQWDFYFINALVQNDLDWAQKGENNLEPTKESQVLPDNTAYWLFPFYRTPTKPFRETIKGKHVVRSKRFTDTNLDCRSSEPLRALAAWSPKGTVS